MRTGRLTGELALVTGSTAGLGVTIAQRFVAEGARVVVTGRDRTRGTAVADKIGAEFVGADLSGPQACHDLVDEAADRLGGLTVLVNNARATSTTVFSGPNSDPALTSPTDGPASRVGWATWEEVLRVGTIAGAVLAGHAIEHMLTHRHGSIVNVSSRAAAQGTPGLAAYTVGKAGLEALARSITADYARHGIRCNNVRPGYIVHAQRDADASEERMHRYRQMHLTRLPTADDVASAVIFLASSESEVISGVTLPVDGGSSAVRGLTLG